MRYLFPKLLKWALSILVCIFGVNMMHMATEGQSWAFMVGISCFGLVYWQYNGRDDIPKEIMFVTLPVVAIAGAAAFYLPSFSFFPFNAGVFQSWAGWSLLLGIPVIGWSFKKFG